MFAADMNMDYSDEIYLAYNYTDTWKLEVYETKGGFFKDYEKVIDNNGESVFFSNRNSFPVWKEGLSASESWSKGRVFGNKYLRAKMTGDPGWGHIASHAVDGMSDTWAQTAIVVPWDLYIDLGEVYSISQLRITLMNGNYTNKFDIRVSNDLENWTTAASEKNGVELMDKTYSFAAVNARYIMIDVLETKGAYGHGIRDVWFPEYDD